MGIVLTTGTGHKCAATSQEIRGAGGRRTVPPTDSKKRVRMCAPSLEQWTPPHRSQAWTIACVAAWLVSGGPVVEVPTRSPSSCSVGAGVLVDLYALVSSR